MQRNIVIFVIIIILFILLALIGFGIYWAQTGFNRTGGGGTTTSSGGSEGDVLRHSYNDAATMSGKRRIPVKL
ncbi:hypothetical protein EJ03DRAFT_348708 [Teratosphaeria nubilosa]|uniref:Uncharacterized protein n=1 Tax=Teratosphaeria nubilosa TaxID=161662 RepID=A0A6G1LID3_9PEZI|nr:hypothetical protein EJ03DRAFT_348708 [Teratosphaeria nubilosa]